MAPSRLQLVNIYLHNYFSRLSFHRLSLETSCWSMSTISLHSTIISAAHLKLIFRLTCRMFICWSDPLASLRSVATYGSPVMRSSDALDLVWISSVLVIYLAKSALCYTRCIIYWLILVSVLCRVTNWSTFSFCLISPFYGYYFRLEPLGLLKPKYDGDIRQIVTTVLWLSSGPEIPAVQGVFWNCFSLTTYIQLRPILCRAGR